jgi:hypothetical protein
MTDALDIGLTCRPRKEGNRLVFDYELLNRSGTAIYAADAIRVVDYESRVARADDQMVCVILRDDGDAVIGKFLPPAPPDRIIVVPVVPLVVRVASGETIRRTLSVPLPLAETSPMVADLTIREYEMLEIQAVVLTINYWPVDTPELAATPAKYAPGHLQLSASDPAAGARLVRQRFPTRGLLLFKRNDAFPRIIG